MSTPAADALRKIAERQDENGDVVVQASELNLIANSLEKPQPRVVRSYAKAMPWQDYPVYPDL